MPATTSTTTATATAPPGTDRPSKRTVLITGASAGIGRACALHLAAHGFRVYAGVRSEADGAALRTAARGGELGPVIIDPADEASVKHAAAAVATSLASTRKGGLDGLVNNAGISLGVPLEVQPLKDIRAHLEANVVGPVAVTQAFLPLLRKARGRVVFLGAAAGQDAVPFLGAYSASKRALEGIADALRVELLPWGIQVVIVDPGAIVTLAFEKGTASAAVREDGLAPEARELYGPAIRAVKAATADAEKRGLPPQSIAALVETALTAARPKTRYVVGADARFLAWVVKRLPDKLRDLLLARFKTAPAAKT